ncbi:MAG: Dyp-type peroxidase [Candidatus Methylumidiphilus sp.]
MTKQLDLLDIQGNVLRAYGRFGYPVSRYVFLNIRDSELGRNFVGDITKMVTTAVEWGEGPNKVKAPHCTYNIAFTYQGLKELGLPRSSLIGFSREFVSGMKARKDILGDDGPSSPENWDPIWVGNREEREKDIHIFISLNAKLPNFLEEGYAALLAVIDKYAAGVVILRGHRGDNGELLEYQDGSIVMALDPQTNKLVPTAKEHFGYTDGISDPVFEGVPYDENRVNGRGKQMEDGSWAPLATGEFLLGHVDEAKEYPPAPEPILLSRNGTYMVYRKLHENVGTFEAYLDEQGKKYPGGKELLAAKFVGRWRDNGAPLVKAPDADAKAKFDAEFAAANEQQKDNLLSGFTYDDDMSGAKCPFSSHIRRINPRASLQMTHEPGDPPGSLKVIKGAFDTPGALANRRRLLRRGLPYGRVTDRTSDKGNHGIIIMMINADIERQFEFVQQQWINYGNDFRASNDKEIILGNHSADEKYASKAVLQVDPNSDDAPYILAKIPRFVETRGGDYFFVPSMTALRMIAQGVIDPT